MLCRREIGGARSVARSYPSNRNKCLRPFGCSKMDEQCATTKNMKQIRLPSVAVGVDRKKSKCSRRERRRRLLLQTHYKVHLLSSTPISYCGSNGNESWMTCLGKSFLFLIRDDLTRYFPDWNVKWAQRNRRSWVIQIHWFSIFILNSVNVKDDTIT